MDITMKALRVIGKIINIVMIIVGGMDTLGSSDQQQLQRLIAFFEEWEKKAGDTYYSDF